MVERSCRRFRGFTFLIWGLENSSRDIFSAIKLLKVKINFIFAAATCTQRNWLFPQLAKRCTNCWCRTDQRVLGSWMIDWQEVIAPWRFLTLHRWLAVISLLWIRDGRYCRCVGAQHTRRRTHPQNPAHSSHCWYQTLLLWLCWRPLAWVAVSGRWRWGPGWEGYCGGCCSPTTTLWWRWTLNLEDRTHNET